MIKKIIMLTLLCVFCISTLSFSAIQENELSIYLNETTNLKKYFELKAIDFTLDENTIIQSSNKQILSIDAYLNLRALAVGETLLILSNDNDLLNLKVTVKSPIKTVEFTESDLVLLAGEIYPINYTIVSQDDYYKPINPQLKWKSSKGNIVGVKAENRLYTHKVGSTVLTGTTYDGSHTITINVQVVANPDKVSIKSDVIDNFVKVGDNRQLSAFFDTKDVTQSVEWESNYPDIAEVDENGLVKPLKAGTAVITAKSSINNKTKDYTLFVRSMVKNISLDQSSIIFNNIGDIQKLNTTLTYKDPDVIPFLDGYYYESSNPSVASVDKNGVVTAQGPGLALINVISNDSQLTDSCSVEVLDNNQVTTIDYSPVREIYLTAESSETIVGHKLLLDVDIEPKDATDQSFKFDIRNGDVNQIHEIDGQYYFVPEGRGNYKIRVVANGSVSGLSDQIEIQVHSPIASLNLDLSIERGKTSERKLYVGETAEVLNDIYTQGLYSTLDVYPSTLDYSVDDTDILKLEYLNGKYYVKALKKGSTTIRVENIEGKHDDYLKVKVSDPIHKIATNNEVRLPVGLSYQPTYTATPTTSAKKQSLPMLDQGINLEVKDFYFAESYLDEEIAYETSVIEKFKSLPTNVSLEGTIESHNKRLEQIQLLKNNVKNGYSIVTNTFLKDRTLRPYKYYEIQGNTITGNYPGKALITLSVNGTATDASTILYWQDDQNDFAIKELTKWQSLETLIKANNLTDVFSELDEPEQVKYLTYYLSNSKFFADVPNVELISALYAIEKTTLDNLLTDDLYAPVTKQELAFIANYIDMTHEVNRQEDTSSIIYYDLVNNDVKLAIANGYIKPNSSDFYGAATVITYNEFKTTVDRILPNNSLPKELDENFNHKQVILLLNQL